jgi:hypothetical protein
MMMTIMIYPGTYTLYSVPSQIYLLTTVSYLAVVSPIASSPDQ